MKRLILLMLFLFSCSNMQIKQSEKYPDIDKQLEPYIEQFMALSNGKVNKGDVWNVTIGFKENDSVFDNTAGTCYIFPFYSIVEINPTYWQYATHLEKEELIFHELGHCILMREHTNPTSSNNLWGKIERFLFNIGIFKSHSGTLPDGCPVSFMHPYTLSEECIARHYTYYIDELFERVPTGRYDIKKLEYNGCKKPIIENRTNEWNKDDEWTLNNAIRVCQVEYRSCLWKLIKKETGVYNAMCNKDYKSSL